VAGGELTVDILPDPVKGTVAVIGVAAGADARRDVEAKIHACMRPFATAYRVEWTE
jgi:hypothetical protein